MVTNRKSIQMRIPRFGFDRLERIAKENNLDIKKAQDKNATWGILCSKLDKKEKEENEIRKIFRI